MTAIGIEANENMSFSEIIQLLRQHMPDAAEIVLRCKNTEDAYMMLRGDYEMRHKIPDVWQWHLNQGRKDMENSRAALKSFLTDKGLKHLVDAYLTEF